MNAEPVIVNVKFSRYGDVVVEPVRGWDFGVPGLVVTELLGDDEESGWSVTHVRSGLGVRYCENPELAVAVLHALADLTDWTLPGETLKAQPGLERRIVAVGRQYGASGSDLPAGDPADLVAAS